MGNEEVILMTAEDILGQDDLKTEDVNMNEFWPPKEGKPDNVIRIRVMPGSGRDRFEEIAAQNTKRGEDGNIIVTGTKGIKVMLCQLSCVDNDNNLLFSPEQINEMNEKSSEAISYLFNKCQDINGLSNDEVEDLVANFEIDLNDENGSNSQQD